MTKYLSRTLLFCVFLAVSVYAAPGLYVEQTTGSNDNTHIAKIFAASDRFRAEEGSTITIARNDLGVIWMFDETEKSYIEMPQSMLKELAAMGQAASGEAGKDPGLRGDAYYRTGKTKKIGEWDCYEVALDLQKRSGMLEIVDEQSLWISTKAYPGAISYFEWVFQALGVSRDDLNKMKTVLGEGFPIETRMVAMGNTTVTRVVKLESRDHPNSLFEPLTGYRKDSFEQMLGK
ncbi:MAG: DUF4412 domain-containing protein [bacterium]|nr:DUF4412 domain-containing protein [bacterium]